MEAWWALTKVSTLITSPPIQTQLPLDSIILRTLLDHHIKTIWWMIPRRGSCKIYRTIGQRCLTKAWLAQITMEFSKTISYCQRQVQTQVEWSRRSIIVNNQRRASVARPAHRVAAWAAYPLTFTTIQIIAAIARSVRFREWRCIYEHLTWWITAASDIFESWLNNYNSLSKLAYASVVVHL